MPALGFQQRHVAAVLDGSKPFTMRKVRKNGQCPRVGDALHLFENWRTPDMRKFATATTALRMTVWFDERGMAKVQHDGFAPDAARIHVDVGDAIVRTGDSSLKVRELALHQLAIWDGFASWSDLWAWHSANGPLDANGHALRRLIGLGNVQPVAGVAAQDRLDV